MEAEIIRWTCNLYNGDRDSCGIVTSGGTESIVLSMLAYREKARVERGVTKPKKSRNGNYTLAPKQNTYLKGTNGIFRPSDSQHKLLRPATPLNDRTNTPRRA